MTPEQKLAISRFLEVVVQLRKVGAVRSHRYLGDIGEFLCADAFDIDLSRNLRQVAIDGHRGQRRVQIKYHGGKTTTVKMGNPANYDEAYVVFGPDSVLRPDGYTENFLIYEFSAEIVHAFSQKNGNLFFTKNMFSGLPKQCISLGHLEA